MPTVIPEVTTEVLQAFADAWNRYDVDALMSFMEPSTAFEGVRSMASVPWPQ